MTGKQTKPQKNIQVEERPQGVHHGNSDHKQHGQEWAPDLAQKIFEQLASIVLQGQPSSAQPDRLTAMLVDAVQDWVKAVWMVPASDLLKAQFDSALPFADVVTPDKQESPMPAPIGDDVEH